MTRIVIFSDLHANWEALLALQQAEQQPDTIIYLGDTVGYGPDPKLCLDSVRANASYLIRGQHDLAVGKSCVHPGSPQSEATGEHASMVLPIEDRYYLASLPAKLNVEIAGVCFHLARLMPDDMETETDMLITMSQARLKEFVGQVEADIILLGGPLTSRRCGKLMVVSSCVQAAWVNLFMVSLILLLRSGKMGIYKYITYIIILKILSKNYRFYL